MVALISPLLAVVLLAAAAPALAQSGARAAETQIKATFLYKFGSFVEWPAGAFARPDSPLAIGVIGSDAIAAELEQVVVGRMVQGRPIVVRNLRRSDPLASLHVLFVGQ